MRSQEQLAAALSNSADAAFRERLLSRGQAQSLIRRDGVLPEGAPSFDPRLDEELLGYGYSLISTALRVLESLDPGEPTDRETEDLSRQSLIQASYAIEAATRNSRPNENLAFHRLVAGAASHLGGYAARAYSLVESSQSSGNLSPMELTLGDLILRDLDNIEERALALRTSPENSDEALLGVLSEVNEDDPETDADSEPNAYDTGPVEALLTENYASAVSTGLFAIAHGVPRLLADAIGALSLGQQAADDIAASGPWWVYRLTRILLADLWATSIRLNIPSLPPPTTRAGELDEAGTRRARRRWNFLRRTFIESLYARGRSEIDLWPSQLHVVERIFDRQDDLVVSLPTSAGKTRIAELCILHCVAEKKRVVYVTPLRALSAQTERILDRTFAPLGISVSSLYGSMGSSEWDENAIRESDIVIATPEKLDFALRSAPEVLDDVGLIVLDEGHMIGPNEREIRYEAQIQRLLRRSDATSRRIVCLSAVFPPGEDLNDFVRWITDESEDGLHQETWRPTQQRFGLVEWRSDHARLTMTFGDEQSFIPRYLDAVAPVGKRKKPFPKDQRELVIATTWRLLDEGQTVLIFCPQRNSVEPYAREVIRLHRQGLIESVLPPDVDLSVALAVGAEWFGEGHPILECLTLGVAIHHGALPGPFRREVERLLQEAALKVTVASPTLAQGLNLSASVVLFHGLRRGQATLLGSEFSNVIGRAGRAFVDTEGLVLCPMYETSEARRAEWLALTVGESGKALQSGLILVGTALIRRVVLSTNAPNLDSYLAYLTGGSAWAFPVVAGESPDAAAEAAKSWSANLALLDIGLLSVIGEEETDPDQVTQLIAHMLQKSLWDRQLERLGGPNATALREMVAARGRHIWGTSTPAQRRGWFLAGLGADAGSGLAEVAPTIVSLISVAEAAMSVLGDEELTISTIRDVASAVFALDTFAPETKLETEDRDLALQHWLRGQPMGELAAEDPARSIAFAQFVESDLIYRLVWGMEAARVYEVAQGNLLADTLTGSILTAVETGTLNWSAALLMKAGFDHRIAAIKAVTDTAADFESIEEMREWIETLPSALSDSDTWPTEESRHVWVEFANRRNQPRRRSWRKVVERAKRPQWAGDTPDTKTWMRVTRRDDETVDLWSPGFDFLGTADFRLNANRKGIVFARRTTGKSSVNIHYRGPGDLHPQDQ